MPRVSVIILSYNQAAFIADAIQSVLTQTYSDWELLVVDNGSTDGTRQVLARFDRDPRIRVVLHDQNDSITRRLNAAVAQTRGEFISLLYSDDFYLPEKLALEVAAFDSLSADYGVVYTRGDRLNVDTGDRWTDPSFSQSGYVLDSLLRALHFHPMNPISPLVRRECFTRYPFYEDLFVEGEYVFLRFAMTFQFHFLPASTVVMRDHASNYGRAIRSNIETILRTLEKLEQSKDFPASARESLRVARCNTFTNAGWQGIRVVNDRAWARRMLANAIRLDWHRAFAPRVAAGLLLSTLPSSLLTRLNRSVDRMRQARGHTNEVPGMQSS